MNELHVEDLIEGVVRENPRFTLEGYLFVREALDYAVGQLEAPRHISGEELLLGVREYALSQFGPMARRAYGVGDHLLRTYWRNGFSVGGCRALGKDRGRSYRRF